MAVIHLVQFKFKDEVTADEVHQACSRMLALKVNCLHPTTKQPYVSSIVGGKDNSAEGLQQGLTHAFVVEFASEDDRDYYVRHDPAHQAFVKSIGVVVEKAQVLDFTPGIF